MRRRLDPKTMQERDDWIMRLKAQGLKAHQIAPQVGLSQGGLSIALKRIKKKQEQQD